MLFNWDSIIFNPIFQPYKQRRLELSIQDRCILWGSHVVVLQDAQEAVIKFLYATKMKS